MRYQQYRLQSLIIPPALIILLVAIALGGTVAQAQTKLLRFPDIHGDRVVFTYGGDLWLAPVSGGTATRLTSHSGVELFAKFSPDGKWIAFTGQVDGDEQVYVMPTMGGVPRQLTHYPARGPLPPRWGYDNQVFGWTPDGQSILFRSHRDSWTLPVSRLYKVAMTGGAAEPLPMPESGAGDYAPDGARVVYSPRSRDFRSEKRYGGGQANDLFVFDLATKEAKRLTDHPRADRDPMWIGKEENSPGGIVAKRRKKAAAPKRRRKKAAKAAPKRRRRKAAKKAAPKRRRKKAAKAAPKRRRRRKKAA